MLSDRQASMDEEPILVHRYHPWKRTYRWMIVGKTSREPYDGKVTYPYTGEGKMHAEKRLKNLHARWLREHPSQTNEFV
ncbi:MAG TPA: hypothetical protein VEB18_04065 [Candidatus Paceibacterota bacterium]|nr:hypothetical protein [Candidatus Paceibacterota bacterium]